jgi:hypothetical protein
VTAFFERARAYGAPPVPVYAPVTQRLHVDGRIFRTDDGRAFRVKFETQFVAPRLFDQGAFDQLEALVAQSHADRYNGWVCFFRHVFVDWNTQIAPPIKANPYVFPMTKRRPFVDWLAARGLYVQVVVLTDCQAFGTDDDGTPLPAFDLAHADQVQDVRETIAALASAPNVLGRIANEPAENGVDVVRLAEDLGLFDRANRPFLMELGSYPITGCSTSSAITRSGNRRGRRRPARPVSTSIARPVCPGSSWRARNSAARTTQTASPPNATR